MAATGTEKEAAHEPHRRSSRLRPLAACDHQFRGLHHLRVQLLQAENETRLAYLRRFSAFIVALFVEMYGFPLTIYLLARGLRTGFPGVDPLGHDFGHLWYTLLGFKGNPHLNPIHIASNLLILGGFLLLSASWRVLYNAQREGTLAVTGPYAYVRHPQYVGFIVIMFGFLLQWPTLITLVMFPVLVAVYVRLAYREEAEERAEFGPAWDVYAARTAGFIPHVVRAKSASIGREKHA